MVIDTNKSCNFTNVIYNTTEKGIAWVEIMGKKYYDEDNKNIRSEEKIHKIIVPMEILDGAKSYKIYFKRVLERTAYFLTSEQEQCKLYNFKPARKKNDLKVYMIADTHSEYKYASKSGKYFEDDLDLLIFNGDIADKSNSLDSIITLYKTIVYLCKSRVYDGFCNMYLIFVAYTDI